VQRGGGLPVRRSEKKNPKVFHFQRENFRVYNFCQSREGKKGREG